ncbi:hypothetical protein ACFVDH_37150 [Streptomyces sp. NPDC057674]|uniref:hypothetical protein n=1 Tax=Streptomyces sp. NPDC057674 TaxID=3346203 RepID=UPI00367E871D
MTPKEVKHRYVRPHKESSKVREVWSSFFAYDADGTYKGEVKLTAKTKERYEAMGFTFKRRNGVMPPEWKEGQGS